MTLFAALTTCTLLGLQHGVDWDHVAAITDVTSVQRTTRQATLCGLHYALGHAATVGLLGIAVITLRRSVPGSVSEWMQRIVGLTLILLGAWVFASLFSGRGPVGRGQAIAEIFRRLHRGHATVLATDATVSGSYGPKSSLSLGVLHGIGAETPTQLSMLVITTSLGGLWNGILGLTVFAMAMFVSNMTLTAAATGVFSISKPRPALFRWLGAMTAVYSLWIGIALMTGRAPAQA